MSANPFWDFSLEHYRKAEVKDHCLRLQGEASANVNVLLFALWLATEKRLFEHDLVLEHAEFLHWHEQVVLPLRQSRCAVKHADLSDSLYQQIKKSELDAERVEQDILYSMLPELAEASTELSLMQLAKWNLRAYLQMLPLAEDVIDERLTGLIRAVFGDVNR